MTGKKLTYNTLVVLFILLPIGAMVFAGVDRISLNWLNYQGHAWWVVTVVMYVLTAGGITAGYHRLFTHASYQTHPAIRLLLGIFGSMAAQGQLLHWVTNHRWHHGHSDQPNDVHSPNTNNGSWVSRWQSFVHSHFLWLVEPSPLPANSAMYVKDLQADPVASWVNRTFVWWIVAGIVLPGVITATFNPSWNAFWLGVIWGGLIRIGLVHHVTWAINSVCHLWGYRRFKNTGDLSRNNWLFGLLALGEGHHNNHHAKPTWAYHGIVWWEIDFTRYFIRSLEIVGLAWDVKKPTPGEINRLLGQ